MPCPSPYFCSLTAHFLVPLIILHCLDIFKFIRPAKVCLCKNTFISKFGSVDKAPLKSWRIPLTPTYTQTDAAAPSQAMHCPHSLLGTVIASITLHRHQQQTGETPGTS